MPSLGQYQRYISQGEIKIAKLKAELANAPNAKKKAEIKDLLNVTTEKVKEHKAAVKAAPKTAPSAKKAGKVVAKKTVAMKVVAKKAPAKKVVAKKVVAKKAVVKAPAKKAPAKKK